MVERISNLLVFFGIALVIFLLWVLSIRFVWRDSVRRNLPFQEKVVWLVLAALFPVVGALAYLVTQKLDRFLSPGPVGNPPASKRVTADRIPDEIRPPLGTVVAADLPRPTFRDQPSTAGPARASPRSLSLRSLSGPLAGQSFRIGDLPARIGRGPLVSVSLYDDPSVSRQHAEIYESAGRFYIRDLQSTHGTYLNGKTVQDAILNPGDQLTVGQSTLVFSAEAEYGRP
jgi:hypothetical protein